MKKSVFVFGVGLLLSLLASCASTPDATGAAAPAFADGDIVTFENLQAGDERDPAVKVWLAGTTKSQRTTLVTDAQRDSSGTRWQVKILSNGMHSFKCLGTDKPDETGEFSWMDGYTNEGAFKAQIRLSDQRGNGHTGTRWIVFPLQDDVYKLQCQGEGAVRYDHENVWLGRKFSKGVPYMAKTVDEADCEVRWRIRKI